MTTQDQSRSGVRALVDAAERYISLFENNPQAVFSLDLDGHYLDANPACERMSGYTLAELRRMHFLDLITPDNHARAVDVFARVKAGGATDLETSIRSKDGRLVEVQLVAMPVCVMGELVGVHGVVEDISARKTAARALDEGRRKAEEADAAKSLLLANMSHELRTPLTTMLATAEMLEDSDLDPVQQRFVQAMQRSGERLRRLIDDILDFSRIEARTLQLRNESFQLCTVVQDLVETLRPSAEAKGLRLEVFVDPDLPAYLIGDALRVSQVMTNLLGNAVKFTEQGDVRLDVRVEQRLADRALISLRVQDTGSGIPDDLMPVLFDPFVQGDPSATRRHEGAGLGLAISRELVRLMGGTIEAHSARDGLDGRDGGTCLTVTVPLMVAPVPRRPRDRPSATRRESAGFSCGHTERR